MDRTIVALAHNIRSLWNVGSLFRTCDCFAVEKIYLTGYTATPPRREISKTAIGAQEWVAWKYEKDPLKVIETLSSEGFRIVALEQAADSIALQKYTAPEKICLIVGHEVTGVPKEILSVCDDIVEIPMHGKKESINVTVAAGIALYHLRSHGH